MLGYFDKDNCKLIAYGGGAYWPGPDFKAEDGQVVEFDVAAETHAPTPEVNGVPVGFPLPEATNIVPRAGHIEPKVYGHGHKTLAVS